MSAKQSTIPAPKIERMRLAYLLEGMDEPDIATVNNRSMIAWDETRAKRQWPTAKEAPSFWSTFILFHHLTRSGGYKGDWEAFKESCLHVEMLEESEPVDPTQPGATPDF